MTDDELLKLIGVQRSLMEAVAIGGRKIEDVNQLYIEQRDRILRELRSRNLKDPNPHEDLWAWSGRWSIGDLGSWSERRAYLVEMYQPIFDEIRHTASNVRIV